MIPPEASKSLADLIECAENKHSKSSSTAPRVGKNRLSAVARKSGFCRILWGEETGSSRYGRLVYERSYPSRTVGRYNNVRTASKSDKKSAAGKTRRQGYSAYEPKVLVGSKGNMFKISSCGFRLDPPKQDPRRFNTQATHLLLHWKITLFKKKSQQAIPVIAFYLRLGGFVDRIATVKKLTKVTFQVLKDP